MAAFLAARHFTRRFNCSKTLPLLIKDNDGTNPAVLMHIAASWRALMISSRHPSTRITYTLAIILMAFQLSACEFEDILSAIAPDVGSGDKKDTDVNNIAKFSGIDTGSVIEDFDPDNDNLLEVGGKLNVTDNDEGESLFIAKAVSGNFGVLDIDTSGNWNYAADNQQQEIQNLAGNATLSDSLAVNSIDGTEHSVEITIIGVTDSDFPAIISGNDNGNVTEDFDPDNNNLLESNGKLNIVDSDEGEAEFIVTTYNGIYGGLSMDVAGNWNYAAANNQASIQNLDTGTWLIDSLTISSLDGTTHTITITINGADEPNTPAIISGTDTGNVTEDIDPDNDNLLETNGNLNISDIDSGESAFISTSYSGTYGSLTINSAGNWSYAANNTQNVIQNLNAGNTLTDNLIVNSVDGTPHTVSITIAGANEIIALSDIQISWTAPSEREDNTSLLLSEIVGYKIYYGTAQGQYSNNITVNDGTAVNYTFQNFNTDTYYFVVTTIDSDGLESQYSTEVQVSI